MDLELSNIFKYIYVDLEIPYILIKDGELKEYSSEREKIFFNKSSIVKNIINVTADSEKNILYINDFGIALASVYIEKTKNILCLGVVILGERQDERIKMELLPRINEHPDNVMSYFYFSPTLKKDEFMRYIKFINRILNSNEYFKNYIKLDEQDQNKDKINVVDLDKTNLRELKHNSYYFEKHLFRCIKNGDINQLRKHLKNNFSGSVEDLTSTGDKLRKIKNMFIAACTLASRAAMDGGLNPELAYSISDYYIQLIDGLTNYETVGNKVNEMFFDYTERVASLIKVDYYSKIVNDVLVYVNEHIAEQINTEEMANELGSNKEYILKKFKRETGKSLINYIQEIKIAEAKLMLQYSELSIIEVSEYLSFANQSYFTQIFKKWTNMTPNEYRSLSAKQNGII